MRFIHKHQKWIMVVIAGGSIAIVLMSILPYVL